MPGAEVAGRDAVGIGSGPAAVARLDKIEALASLDHAVQDRIGDEVITSGLLVVDEGVAGLDHDMDNNVVEKEEAETSTMAPLPYRNRTFEKGKAVR
jgi:hypothetical protein